MEKEQRFQDVVADEILKAFGLDSAPKPSDPGFWQKHCDRYHPEGFKEGSSCKYLDVPQMQPQQKEAATSLLEQPAAGMPDPYASHIKGKSISDLEAFLRDEVGMESFHATEAKELRRKLFVNPELEYVFREGGQPVTREAYNLAVKVVAATLMDLRKRFGNFRLPNEIFIPWDWSENLGGIGRAARDNRKDNYTEPYLSIGDLSPFLEGKAMSDSYCPNAALSPYAVARHEIGHCLATDEIFEDFDVKKRTINQELEESERSKKSVWGPWFKTERIWEDSDEILAEIFQRYTAPDYKQQKRLPIGMEQYCKTSLI